MTDLRQVLTAIGELPDVEIDIAGAAVQLARMHDPHADWERAQRHLSELARASVALAAKVTAQDGKTRAQALAKLFRRHGYAGDETSYDDLENANLIHVIERRRGLPVALGILWLHCARTLGWPAKGLDFPGHFLVGIEGKGPQAVVDVFAGGRCLDDGDLVMLIRQVEGDAAELRAGLLAPMNTRSVLLRLENNIKGRQLLAKDLEGALATTQNMLQIAPQHAALWREAAWINQGLGRVAAALDCFQRFLALVPDGAAAASVRAEMEELRTRLN
jgi:regulator of sirC expression with transglutaminase-like and TPR domain